MKNAKLYLAGLCLVLASVVANGSGGPKPDPRIIELHHISAAEVQPIVEAMLGDDGWVKTTGQKLVIGADPGQVDAVRDLVASLDVPRARLQLTFNDRPPQGMSGMSHSRSTRRAESGAMPMRLQMLAGVPAWIQNGQAVPVVRYGGGWLGAGPVAVAGQDYYDVSSGFYAVAQLDGDQVTLSLTMDRNRLTSGTTGPITVDRGQTQVRGPIGTWIRVVGGPSEDMASQGNVRSLGSTRSANSRSLWVRVDRL